MLAWLKKYWAPLILCAWLVAILDGMISSLMTCHPITRIADGGANAERAKEYCTALHGPILITIQWLAHIAHKYEGLITAAFTIVLAAFTGRLWYSTEKLWTATNRTTDISERALTELEAPFLAIKITDPGTKRILKSAIIL
jgi:hypothetical protein